MTGVILALSSAGGVVVGAAIAGGIALIGSLIQWQVQKGQREAQRDIAREEREHVAQMAREEREHDALQADRARRHETIKIAYPLIQRWVIEEMAWADRTCPMLGSTQERPTPLTDDDIWNLQTQVYAYASEPLKVEMDKFLEKRRLVILNCMFHSEQKQRGEGATDYYMVVQKERELMKEPYEAIRRLIRDELAPTAALPVSQG